MSPVSRAWPLTGFTQRLAAVSEELRGTYAWMAHPAAIEHLVDLGVSAVELMPVQQFVQDSHLLEKGLSNYWGYNTIGFLAPQGGAYSSAGDQGGRVDEFKGLVKALHAAGLEVYLDVVYNHTAEGNHLGPTLSFTGTDNASYYRLVDEDRTHYFDTTGTGNSLNLSHPAALGSDRQRGGQRPPRPPAPQHPGLAAARDRRTDDLGRGRDRPHPGGNNNAYCQDTELSWYDWDFVDTDLLDFTTRLIALRRAEPALRPKWFRRDPDLGTGSWVTIVRSDGYEFDEDDWSDRPPGPSSSPSGPRVTTRSPGCSTPRRTPSSSRCHPPPARSGRWRSAATRTSAWSPR